MGKFARWIGLLQAYDMTIVHRPGKNQANADAISRRTYPTSPESEDVEVDDFLPLIGENFDFTTPKVSQPAVRAITTTPQPPTPHPRRQLIFPYPM